MAADACQDCGAADPRVWLDGVALCDRCADRRVARLTGWPQLPDPTPAVVISGPDGRDHELHARLWRAPTGVVVELEETGVRPGTGYQFCVLGPHDADVGDLIAQVQAQAEAEIARRYLEPSSHRPGWILRHDEVAGRLVYSEAGGPGGPYDVVVDGRTLTWQEFGRALEPYEGWRFRLVLEDRSDDARPDADVVSLPQTTTSRPRQEAPPMSQRRPSTTIDDVLSEFLAEQEQRLAPRTMRNYRDIIDLLRDCLNGYGHQYLDSAERRRFQAAYDRGDEEAFVHLFGPEKIADALGEFLGYFMIRKVAAGQELLRAAGTVTRKLARWLGEKGYLDAAAAEVAVDRGADAARELPKAERLARLLWRQAEAATADLRSLGDEDIVEDYLVIERVQPGAIWFEGGIGPVPVSKQVSDLAEPGWSVNVVLARSGDAWQLVEVGNVYP